MVREVWARMDGLRRFHINYIDGHDLKFKTFVTDAADEDDALLKLRKEYEPYGDFDHRIESIREV